ncbi:hypothetical protein I4U23_030784 [Adineta vaga]|nr:hypothetical protein I4U23_030784 [Adineta vaga]
MASIDNCELSLTCAICLDVASAENAIETSCCHHLFCFTCITTVETCPVCRQTNFKTIPAYFARRMIGNMFIQCPSTGCKEKITRSNLMDHLSNHCTYSVLLCPDPNCKNFKCIKKDFLKHLTKQHREILMENYKKLWPTRDATDRSETSFESNERLSLNDRIEGTRNTFGRYARLGSNGKFYCGGALDGARCSCCNGYCGVTNGCNCSACMLLDVQKRQLSYGWLVNRDGAAARCSQQEPTKFYCGRNVLTPNARTDGYCGPTDGEQCPACRTINEQRPGRYKQIWT